MWELHTFWQLRYTLKNKPSKGTFTNWLTPKIWTQNWGGSQNILHGFVSDRCWNLSSTSIINRLLLIYGALQAEAEGLRPRRSINFRPQPAPCARKNTRVRGTPVREHSLAALAATLCKKTCFRREGTPLDPLFFEKYYSNKAGV